MPDLLKEILGPAGALVLALAIIFGGYKEWWVYGREYKRLRRENQEWKDMALRGANLAERVTHLADKDNHGTV